MHNEVYDEIKIDTSLIPDYLVESLAAATLQFVKELKQNPVTNKMLEEKKKNWGYNNVTPNVTRKAENNRKNNLKILCFGYSCFFKS